MSILKVLTDGTVEVHHFPKAGVSEELTVLQGHVGGYIETVPLHCFTDDMEDVPSFQKIVCLADEEGLIKKLPVNRLFPRIVGNIVFVGIKGDKFAGLTALQIARILQVCRKRARGE